MRHLKCMIILFLAWQSCLAQDFNTYFHHLTVENGLSEATNDYVYQDSRGFVWIGSVSGLNRFDGRQVRVYQPESSDSSSLFGQNIQGSFFEDDNTDIWFSTYEGVNQYVRKTDSFKHYTLIDSTTQQPFAGYYIAHLDDKGQLWLLVNEQFIYIFDTKTHQFTKKHAVIGNTQRLRIQSDEQKKVVRTFAYTWNSGSLGMQMTEYLTDGKLKQETLFDKTSNTPLSIFDLFAENEQIWITTNKGLHKFDVQSKNLNNYNFNAIVIAVQSLSPKELLVTTRGKGALIVDKSNGKIVKQFTHSIDNRHSLAANNPVNNWIDKNKNIWIQIDGQGVDFTNFEKTKFGVINHYPTEKNLVKPFTALFSNVDENGFLWSSTLDKTLRQFDKNGLLKDSFVVNTPSSRGLKATNIFLSFMDKQSRFWVQSFKTLQFFDAKTLSFKDLPKNDLLFLYSLVTQSGKILIATFNGVYELSEITPNAFDFKPISQISNKKPHAILFEDNNQWIWGSYDAISIRVYNALNNYGLVKELPINGVITGFWHQPNSSFVWVCSQNGLYKIDKNTWQFVNFTEDSGLPSRTINTMQADEKGNLWLGTSKGLAKFDPSVEKAKAYNLVDGISDLNFNMYASTQAADGTMYFGTNNGITTFHPDKIVPLSIKARPTITEILLNDKIAKNLVCSTTKATNVSEIQSLELPYSDNTLSFNFSAMEYSDPMQCLFQYKMEGVDKDWVKAGTLPFARYANLPAGNYTFLIKASNSDGEWNETPRTLHIKITPPFYKTWWFLSLMALATIALATYIVYLRLSKVIALQKIRLNLYENLHDDIGSRLTAIVLSVDELVQRTPLKDAKLERIGTISKNIVANMRRLVWATAPENDALSTVAQQMQSDRRVLLPSGTAFRLTMDTALENLNIGGDKRYQMLSIFNEALTNIAKYADASAVDTCIELKDQTVIMRIVDNGKGFDPDARREDSVMSSGHGLRNMQRRAERIKGDVAITSTLGAGTSIKLSFPMHDETIWAKLKDVLAKYHLK